MIISLSEWEKKYIEERLASEELGEKISVDDFVNHYYNSCMEANFEQDIHDIINENYAYIKKGEHNK